MNLAEFFHPFFLAPKGVLPESISFRPGRVILSRPGAIQFMKPLPVDWWLVEAALAGWTLDA